MASITKSEIQDLINKINNQISLRKNTGLSAISDVENGAISYSKMNELNTYRRTLASKNRYTGCSTVTCGTVGSGAPSGWNGVDLTTYAASGETPLVKGNIAWTTQINILKNDITKLDNMCACNTYKSDYTACSCESHCSCQSESCGSNCDCNTAGPDISCTCHVHIDRCTCDRHCYCQDDCTCENTCSCQRQHGPCGCYLVCKCDGVGCPSDKYCQSNSYVCSTNCDCHGDQDYCSCNKVCYCQSHCTCESVCSSYSCSCQSHGCGCESQDTCGCNKDCVCHGSHCTCNYNCVEFNS